jgi:hypothetical protein
MHLERFNTMSDLRSRILNANQRVAAPHGAKMLIVGETGVGKTSLARTLDAGSGILIDVEAGTLAIADVGIDTAAPRTWPQIRDITVALAGADPAVPTNGCYSSEHLAAVHDQYDPERLSRYQSCIFDSITAVSRLCFRWAEQQPEAFSDRSNKRDLRSTHGLLAREMIAWLTHLQHARGLNVILIGILETVTDDFGRTERRLQMEGSRTARELPGIVDEIVTMAWVDFGDGVLTRSFICTAPNRWQYPAKDRSGRLDQIEEPHLGKLIDKLTKPWAAASTSSTATPQMETEG